MLAEEIRIISGENDFQTASYEKNEKTLDYEISKNPTYGELISIVRGLNAASEFFDVKAAILSTGTGICAVSLGKTLEEAVKNVMDSNPIDFMSSTLTVTSEVDSDVVKLLKDTNIIVAPKYTKNAIEYLQAHDICYLTIHTPLKEYKKYQQNEVKVTPLGTLTQIPNLSELDKDKFKVVSKTKPTVEQIEDSVFAWKVAKHISTQAIVIAKDLKTTAIVQGLQKSSVEYAIDHSCDMSKEAILASDLPITVHDVNVAAQGRISLIILPFAQKDIVAAADKYNMVVITTGMTNILY